MSTQPFTATHIAYWTPKEKPTQLTPLHLDDLVDGGPAYTRDEWERGMAASWVRWKTGKWTVDGLDTPAGYRGTVAVVEAEGWHPLPVDGVDDVTLLWEGGHPVRVCMYDGDERCATLTEVRAVNSSLRLLGYAISGEWDAAEDGYAVAPVSRT